jgi:aconitase A
MVIAGQEYGTGSSRDWAAKGVMLLGVKAVIATSFERIHRSNLVGMGVLPLQFVAGQTRESLGLTGEEVYTFEGLSDTIRPRQEITVPARPAADESRAEPVMARPNGESRAEPVMARPSALGAPEPGNSAASAPLREPSGSNAHPAHPVHPVSSPVLAGEKRFFAIIRLDTPVEIDYYRHGGILPMVLRRMLTAQR